MSVYRPWRLVLMALLLAGCNALPTSGPTLSEVTQGANAQNPLDVHIIPLNQGTMLALNLGVSSPLAAFRNTPAQAGSNDEIGIGDTLAISVFESGNALFSPSTPSNAAGQAGGPSGSVSNINLPLEQVDDQGNVDIPYGGLVRAAGLTPDALAQQIEDSLAGQSQNPQVIVTIAKSLADTVIISGAVHSPGRIPLTLAHEQLLDVVAIAGGSTEDQQDVFVTLTRDGQSARILMSDLETDPTQNVYLEPGDRIALTYDPRSFTVFGAAQKVQQVNFEAPQLSLAEALARAGGPADAQADPNGVFVFRFENAATAGRLGLQAGKTADAGGVPVIYQLDMMQPDSYFYAQKFAMRDQDLLYISNAKTNKLSKLFGLIGNLVSPAATVNNFAH